jgi:hypothetical protein
MDGDPDRVIQERFNGDFSGAARGAYPVLTENVWAAPSASSFSDLALGSLHQRIRPMGAKICNTVDRGRLVTARTGGRRIRSDFMVNESLRLHRQMEGLIADIRREGDGQAAAWRRSIDRAGVEASAENLALSIPRTLSGLA